MSSDKMRVGSDSRSVLREKWDLSQWDYVDGSSSMDVRGLKQIANQIIKEPTWQVFIPGARLAAALPHSVKSIIDSLLVRSMTKYWPHREPMASALVLRSKDGASFGGICLYQIARQSSTSSGDFVINGLYLLPELRGDQAIFMRLAIEIVSIIDTFNTGPFAGQHPLSSIFFLAADTKALLAFYRRIGAKQVTNSRASLSKGIALMEVTVENVRLFSEGKPILRSWKEKGE